MRMPVKSKSRKQIFRKKHRRKLNEKVRQKEGKYVYGETVGGQDKLKANEMHF
jgi:hypothetical protein